MSPLMKARAFARSRHRESSIALVSSEPSLLSLAPETLSALCVIWLGGCLAMCMVGIVVILRGQEDELSHDLVSYKEVVNRWKGQGLEQFAGLNVTAEFAGQAWQLEANSGNEEDLLPSSSESLPDYRPLHYYSIGLPSIDNSSTWNEAMVGMNITLRTSGTQEDKLQLVGFHVMMSKVVSGNHKVCYHRHQGHFLTLSTCQVFYHLTHICVKVSRSSGGGWALDASGGGYGCQPGADKVWSPYIYEKEHLEHGGGWVLYPPTTYATQAVVLEVRSAEDPLLGARAITAGSAEFPPSRGSLLCWGTTMIVVGWLLIFCGASLWWQARRHSMRIREPFWQEGLAALRSPRAAQASSSRSSQSQQQCRLRSRDRHSDQEAASPEASADDGSNHFRERRGAEELEGQPEHVEAI